MNHEEAVEEVRRVVAKLRAATEGENGAVACDALLNTLVVVTQRCGCDLEGVLGAVATAWVMHIVQDSAPQELEPLRKDELC